MPWIIDNGFRVAEVGTMERGNKSKVNLDKVKISGSYCMYMYKKHETNSDIPGVCCILIAIP